MPNTNEAPPAELLIRRYHRAPRYPAFIGTGIVLGLVVAGGLTFFAGEPGDYSPTSVLGYLSALLGLLGGLFGGLAAVILDKR